jgi:hypothetical protein
VRSAVLFILALSCVRAADFPMTIVSADEAETIHSAIVRKEAWTLDTVRRLRAEAEKKMKEGPWSITFDRPRGVDIDPHDYYSEAPYWWPNPENPDGEYVRREGQVNPSRFLANNAALNSMCDAVLTLGTASFLLDDPRYSQKASRVIQTWFIASKTRMNPNLNYAQSVPGINEGHGGGAYDGRCLLRAVQGMEFLAQTGGWDAREQAAARRWFEDYLRWITDSKNAGEERTSSNNHASWWTAQVAGIATFVDNKPATEMAFSYYRDSIFPRQIRDGSAPRDLDAFSIICRIAQVHGTDLWSAHTRSGATLGTVIDKLHPAAALDPKKPVKDPIADYPIDSLYFLAFAGMGLKKPEYVAQFRKLEHPDSSWLYLVDLMVGRWESAAHQTRH